MLTIILLTGLLAFLIAYTLRKRSKLPPGPFPFPIIGNLPQIGWMTARHGGIVGAFKEWKKEYGPVFTVWMGPQPTVHITTMELAQETMIKRGGEFTDRWVPLLFNIARNDLGIIGTSGDRWVEQRRFALHTLRNFGLGRNMMEDRIMEEFNLRADALDKKIGKDLQEFDPQPFFDMMVGSIINRMLLNEALDEHSGAEFYEHKHNLEMFLEKLSFIDFLVQNKALINLPIIRNRIQKMSDPQLGVKKFLRKQIDDRIAAIEKGEHVIQAEPEDYVDAFLQKMKEEEGLPDTTYDLDALNINLLDLWIAGQETTVTTLIAGFAQLLNHPEMISKIREELMEVTKGERHVSLKDKPNTPYFNATLMEVQRQASILNVNLFRRTKEDITIAGFPVEKGTPVTAELSVLMSDESHFKDSQNFDPSRFLQGEKLDQFVIPFGIGKRSCLGESLARAELYLILGNMILRYDIQPSDVLPSTQQRNSVGVLKRPVKYTMRLRKIE